MTRPRIWKEPRFGGRPWCATHPYKPATWQLCKTYREAVEYVADALANPFPLELENVDEEPMTVEYIDRGVDRGVVITDEGSGHLIVLDRHHWRPLARALTRLADKEGIE